MGWLLLLIFCVGVFFLKLWTPLVPPENHDDVYTDSVMCLMYSSTPIPESQLPPLFVRRGNKRQRTDLSCKLDSKFHGKVWLCFCAKPYENSFARTSLSLFKKISHACTIISVKLEIAQTK